MPRLGRSSRGQARRLTKAGTRGRQAGGPQGDTLPRLEPTPAFQENAMPLPYNSAVPPLAQSMMQRGVGLGGAPNMNAAIQARLAQEAQQNPALQNPAVMRQVQDRIGQMQNHASQLQSQGVPAAQAMQHAAQRFTPPGAVGASAGMARPFGAPPGFSNPLNGMFGPPPMMPPAGPAPQMGQRMAPPAVGPMPVQPPVPAPGPVAAPAPMLSRNPF